MKLVEAIDETIHSYTREIVFSHKGKTYQVDILCTNDDEYEIDWLDTDEPEWVENYQGTICDGATGLALDLDIMFDNKKQSN